MAEVEDGTEGNVYIILIKRACQSVQYLNTFKMSGTANVLQSRFTSSHDELQIIGCSSQIYQKLVKTSSQFCTMKQKNKSRKQASWP